VNHIVIAAFPAARCDGGRDVSRSFRAPAISCKRKHSGHNGIEVQGYGPIFVLVPVGVPGARDELFSDQFPCAVDQCLQISLASLDTGDLSPETLIDFDRGA
jgi:hypothetical protein